MALAHYFHSYMFEFQEFITGYHVYKDVWTPFHGEKLSFESHPDNFYDKYAFKVVKMQKPLVMYRELYPRI